LQGMFTEKQRTCFTLIELLAVIGIIALLAAFTLGVTQIAVRKGSEAKVRAQMEMLTAALQKYREDYGYYPQYDGDLQWNLLENELVDPQTGHNYLQLEKFKQSGSIVEDPFGKPYKYDATNPTHNQQSYDLWSRGYDMTGGTEDDVTNWRRN